MAFRGQLVLSAAALQLNGPGPVKNVHSALDAGFLQHEQEEDTRKADGFQVGVGSSKPPDTYFQGQPRWTG